MAEGFACNGHSAVGKIGCGGVEYDVANPRSRLDRLSGDHHDFAALRYGEQRFHGSTADLPGAAENDRGEVLVFWKRYREGLPRFGLRYKSQVTRGGGR